MPSLNRTATDAIVLSDVARRPTPFTRTTTDTIARSDAAARPTRNTHHRQHDHHSTDLDTNIVLNGAVGQIASGTNLHAALATIGGSTTINVIFDGGASVITTGEKLDLELPFAGVITAARLFADQSGSIVIDLWKDAYANYPPTVADTITAAAKPTLASAIKSQDTTLTGWTTAFAAGDTLRLKVDSATTVTRVTLALTVLRT